MTENANQADLAALTADIVASHVSNNSVSVSEVAILIQSVHEALANLSSPSSVEPSTRNPAVSVRSSIKPDYLVCLECGAKLKTLKRHLRTSHGNTPEQYRKEFGLPDSYPMSAIDYSEMRRGMARSIGLGSTLGTGRMGKAKKKA